MHLFTLVITLIPLQSFAWIVAPKTVSRQVSAHVLFSTNNGNEAQVAGKGEHVHLGLDTQNPCWQDIFDNDCAMSTVYSASFVAKDWIRSMPCAEGIEDCDMPEATTHPGHEGVEDVDVMEFLGIKRAQSVQKKQSESSEEK